MEKQDVSQRPFQAVFDPEQAVAEARREFGEHGGVSPSIERSSTFTVMEPGVMPEKSTFAGTPPTVTTGLSAVRESGSAGAACPKATPGFTGPSPLAYTTTQSPPATGLAGLTGA